MKETTEVTENRKLFLETLRSGNYKKKHIKLDERGSLYDENRTCLSKIMGDLFGKLPNGITSLEKASKALGLTLLDLEFIQQNISNRKLTLKQDANAIETLFFNDDKLNKLKKKVDKYLVEVTHNELEEKKATYLERIWIDKIIHDFRLSGKKIYI